MRIINNRLAKNYTIITVIVHHHFKRPPLYVNYIIIKPLGHVLKLSQTTFTYTDLCKDGSHMVTSYNNGCIMSYSTVWYYVTAEQTAQLHVKLLKLSVVCS